MTNRVPVRHREQLHYLLAEAAEIEHDLMCCYLYAGFSLKDDRDDLPDDDRALVSRWRSSIRAVAIEEMTHLSLVSNLLTAVGAAPHFGRQNFPTAPGVHPAGVVVSLAPFDLATLDHFIFLERPEGLDLPDGEGFSPPRAYDRGVRRPGLMPAAQDFATVGELYAAIREGLEHLASTLGEPGLFIGDPRAQVGSDLLGLPGMHAVTSLADARRAIDTIVRQGEGSPGHVEGSHYERFTAIRDEYRARLAADPSFRPAYPAARNPVMRRPPTPEGRVWITHPDAEDLVDLSNAVYTFALRLLCQGFSAAGSVDVKRVAIDAAVDAMSALDGLATALTRLPAREEGGEVTAGVSFALLRSIAALPDWPSQWTFLAERAGQLREGATKLSRLDPRVERAASTLARVESALRERVAPPATVSAATTAREPAPAVTESAPSPDVEEAHADGVTLRFEGRRCIHARRCVLSEPRVFLANVKGPWLHPEAVSVERVARVAQACPSGAITYLRRDGGPNEEAPEVNTAAVRENGPLALHGDLRIAGEAPRFRATLCRCGRSQKKPFCDGAHAQGFEASGEPPTRESAALEARGGPLEVTPMKDGPLDVRGSLELCSGTGRTILRTARTRLCRCGGSSNKPYCDGTHARIGFRAE